MVCIWKQGLDDNTSVYLTEYFLLASMEEEIPKILQKAAMSDKEAFSELPLY